MIPGLLFEVTTIEMDGQKILLSNDASALFRLTPTLCMDIVDLVKKGLPTRERSPIVFKSREARLKGLKVAGKRKRGPKSATTKFEEAERDKKQAQHDVTVAKFVGARSAATLLTSSILSKLSDKV